MHGQTATLARLADRLREGGGEAASAAGADADAPTASPSPAPEAAAGGGVGGEASSDEARRFPAELRLVSTMAPGRRGTDPRGRGGRGPKRNFATGLVRRRDEGGEGREATGGAGLWFCFRLRIARLVVGGGRRAYLYWGRARGEIGWMAGGGRVNGDFTGVLRKEKRPAGGFDRSFFLRQHRASGPQLFFLIF